MRVILVGSTGQLGKHLCLTRPNNVNLIIPNRSELDLAKNNTIFEYFLNNPAEWVINSAAFTNVDKAETDKELVFRINAYGPESIAKALSKTGGKFLQISTDYVFSGAQNIPYKTSQNLDPCNVYGHSKAEGENRLIKRLTSMNQLSILRTSWLMSPFKGNFASNMIRLLNEKDQLKVVYDQIGSPTSALNLAKAIWKIIEVNELFSLNNINFPKISHFADDGVASWYDVASFINQVGIKKGLIKNKSKIFPIRTIDYPTPANRPVYSILETQETKKLLKINGVNWRDALLENFEVDLSALDS